MGDLLAVSQGPRLRAPLTPTQRDVYLDQQLHPDVPAYSVGCSACLGRDVERDLWEEAVRTAFEAEPIMRTRLEESDAGLFQCVDDGMSIHLGFDDGVAADPDALHAWITARLREVRAPNVLFQHWLVRTADGDFHSALGASHLFCDGHSYRVLFDRIGRCYDALQERRSPPRLAAPSFYDYLREAAPVADEPEALERWRARLAGVVPLHFRTRREAPGEYGAERLRLTPAETEAVAAFCRARGFGPATFFLALHAILLQRYREPGGDWVVHAIRRARPAGFRDTIGCFFRMLPYRMPEARLRRPVELADLFAYLRDYGHELGQRQDISMLRLQDCLPDAGCRAIYNFYDFDSVHLLGRPRTLEAYFAHPPGEVHLAVASRDGCVELRHFFHTSQLSDRTLLARMRRLALQVIAGAERIADLDWLLDGERAPQAAPAKPPPKPARKSVQELFEEQAARQPDAVAVVAGERRWTYVELNRYANRLARLLVGEGVRPGVLVGLHLDRSCEQVAAVLAVLKAGGAYVPIDPDYPEARGRFILDDSRVELLVTDGTLGNAPHASSARTLRLDEAGARLEAEAATNLGARAALGDLAYVIYTSGSTGQPKGVMVTRHNVSRLFRATQEVFAFDAGDVWTLLHSYAFDFSVWEMWGALAFGGRLVVVPSCVARAPDDLCDLLEREGVTVLNQTPSAFYRFMEGERLRGDARLEALRWIVLGGEALGVARLRSWFDRYGDARPTLVNMYGITETTVHATWRRLRRADTESGRPSVIGRPLADLRVYLTDEEGDLVPRGVAGELCVAGEGVVPGYLHREELTAARFSEDRFAPATGDRLYRSGDLGRELDAGDLEYLGRVDDQVQVRGYRVELGEIESVLREHPGVADAAAVAHANGHGDLTLAAYVVREAGAAVAEPELRELLRCRLPAYMGCARYVFLAGLPLTAHGKLDRAALPMPGSERPELGVRYVAPRSQSEEFLAGAFRDATGLERVGVHDDFFALGGNSLSAMEVLGRVREALGLALPLYAIFEAPTIVRLAEAIESGRFAGDAEAPPRVARAEDGDDPPLTLAQERVWLIQQLTPQSVAYQFEASFRFRGDLRVDLLERCLGDLVQRHEVLRTSFPAVAGRPVQRIDATGRLDLETVSLEHLGPEAAAQRIEQWRRETAEQPLAVDRLPLIRWTLFGVSARDHVLLHREHHLLHDGWSFIVLAGELLRLYEAYLDERPSPLPPLPLRLGDFAHAEREWLSGPSAERQLDYWRRQLAGAPQSLELPADFARPARSSHRGDALRLDLPDDVVRSLRALASENGVTLFVAMLGAFAVLLARYSGERDLCIGSGVANRRRPELEGIVGMMLNNVILRLDLREALSLASVLKQAQRVVLEALSNQDLPFDRVVRLVRSGAESPGTAPVAPVFFSSYEGPMPQVPIPGLAVAVEGGLPNGSAKFDLNVIVLARAQDAFSPPAGAEPDGERVTLIWEYSTDLFERATMEGMLQDYVSLLGSSADDGERAWDELELDSETDALALAAGSCSSYPRDASIVELWREQVARSPDAVAVRDVHGAWTYRELEVTANRLAHALRHRGVGEEEVVGVCLPRGRAAVASMLGVLKSGAAYLPLDPSQPGRRIALLASEAGTRFVLTYASSRPLLRACANVEPLCLDELEKELTRCPEAEPRQTTTGDSLAYVMFTSGSTGPPKGVETLHRGVVRLLFGTDYVRLGRDTRILQLAPLSFDASTFEIWAALLHGGTLIVHPADLPDTASLGRAIADEGINTMWLNASLFNVIVEQGAAILARLEQLLIGGEALSVEHVRRAYRQLPRTQIINGYGPTENTTFSCCLPIPRELPASAATVPLGPPIAHSSAYVLDERMRPLPRGAIGEIYLGGDGLARGYRAQPKLTAERFVPDPWSPTPGARLYRSGDFGRYRADGTLEFRGRRDDQVKIRGFRIEPAEIEWGLQRLPGVRQSAVVGHREGAGSTQLVAYVVPEPGTTPDSDQLRARARQELPSHLVPQTFVVIDTLPLSPHGKLDRKALPPPPPLLPAARPSAPPSNAREEIIAGVMADVLGVEEVGREDQFFDLGGHSLLGLELVGRLSLVFGVAIPVRALIENPTVAGVAALIELEEDRPGDMPAERNGSPCSLVAIKPGGSKQPLFFSPGGDGGDGALLVYAKVARFVGAEQPFYGLKAKGTHNHAAHRSVEEMATAYLGEVKQAQAQGPYFFAGECVGGVIAYEMARQVMAAGDEMGLLVLLDSRPPRLASHARHWLRFLSSRARRRADEVLGPLVPAPVAKGRGGLAKASLRRWLDGLLPYDAREAPPTIDRAWVEYQRTLLDYRPRPYEGRMALLLSDQYAARNVDREWQRLVRGGVDVQRVPGDHDSYIRQHARETAAILAACLDDARARM